MPRNVPFNFRATAKDLASLAEITAHLHKNGVPFATRSDAMRHAITVASTTLAFLPAPKVPAE